MAIDDIPFFAVRKKDFVSSIEAEFQHVSNFRTGLQAQPGDGLVSKFERPRRRLVRHVNVSGQCAVVSGPYHRSGQPR